MSSGNLGSYLGINYTMPQAPNAFGSPQQQQQQANTANQLRYGQGLQTLAAGNNAQQQSITNAMDASKTYGQTALQNLGLQYQNAQGQATQQANTRGLGDTTIAQTMQALPTRTYNQGVAQVNEQQAQLASGLQLNMGNAQAQGANSIANYISQRNDMGPNQGLLSSLAQKAASNAGQPKTLTPPAPLSSDFGSGGGGGRGGAGGSSGGNPNTSNGGGAGSASGSTGGPLSIGGFGQGAASSSGNGNTGYTAGSLQGSGGAPASSPDQTGGSAFFGNGSSVTPGDPAKANAWSGMPLGGSAGAASAASTPAPSAPVSISSAMQPAKPGANMAFNNLALANSLA